MTYAPPTDDRHALLDQLKHVGAVTTARDAQRLMSPEQVRRLNAPNMMTDDVWQLRALGHFNGCPTIVVEIAHGMFLDSPLFGLTVYSVGALKGDAEEWDHSLSACYHSVAEAAARVHELDVLATQRARALAGT